MDKKNEKKKTSSTFEKKEKPPHDWHVTEEDKTFLRACNIRPD